MTTPLARRKLERNAPRRTAPVAQCARVRCLSIQADYRCRHSGACCTNGWAVPVETPLYRRLAGAVAGGRIRLPSGSCGIAPRAEGLFQGAEGLPEGKKAVLAHAPDGSCVFFDRAGGNLCAIHRDIGPDSLPSACRLFPRVCLIDPRGVFITLSHYCPTAARQLFRNDCGLAIVEDPPAFAPRADYEGLDAREALPPLLRPDALFDWESYDAFEHHIVSTLARDELSPEAALRHLARTAEEIRGWRAPAPVHEHVRRAIDSATDPAPEAGDLAITPALYRLVLTCVAPGLRRGLAQSGLCPEPRLGRSRGPDAPRRSLAGAPCAPMTLPQFERAFRRWVAPAWSRFARPIRWYLATKGFASWFAYQGKGARTMVLSMAAALAVVRVEAARRAAAARRPLEDDLLLEAFRAADLLLVHLVTRERLAHWLARIEAQPADRLLEAIGPG